MMHGFRSDFEDMLPVEWESSTASVTSGAMTEKVFKGGRFTEEGEGTVCLGSTTSFVTGELPSSSVTGEELAGYDGDGRFARWVIERAGLDFGNDGRQRWRVGEHELTVAVWLEPSRCRYVLLVAGGWPVDLDENGRPLGCPARLLLLVEVFAIVETGVVRKLNRPEASCWKRRALADAGLIELHPVKLPALSSDAPAAAVKTWEVIADLLSIRRLTDEVGTPLGLVAPWLEGWNRRGVRDREIQAGKRWLERRGFIERAGTAPSRFSARPMILWRVAEHVGPL